MTPSTEKEMSDWLRQLTPEQQETSDRLRRELHSDQPTPEALAAHTKVCNESEGFDVPDVPDRIVDFIVRPSYMQNNPDALQFAFGDMSKIALEEYNRVNKTQYQFVNVIKVNSDSSLAVRHYITFQAEEDGSPPQNFQARICPCLGAEKMVELCKLEVNRN